MSNIAIGVDLGTTNSCVACYINGEKRILENEEGQRVTPSFLFFTEKAKVLVGQYALKMSKNKPEYGIYGIKRLVGRKFDDPYVQNNLQYFPYNVINNGNECVVAISQKETTIIQKSPQELCAMILKKLKKDAESKLGEEIEKAVITVPAYFNMRQREITLAAAQEAGFIVLKLLNEPTAAALNYYFDYDVKEDNYSLVYDLGGGTFDVSILNGNKENISILGVDGDTHLGGHDFDIFVLNYIVRELLNNYNFSPKSNRRLMRRLLIESEDAKKTLSVSEETTVFLEAFVPNESVVSVDITREQFEEMANDSFQKTVDIVDRCLKSCNLKKSDIDQVILAGGSTRIPKIQEMLSAFFGGKKLNRSISPDECVAVGAALQAAMLSTNPAQKIDTMKVTDVTPLSLGISNFVNLMTVYIKRNTPIPFSNTFTRVTVENLQSTMRFDVYEGERMEARKNRHLASVSISDLTPAAPGQCAVNFTLSLDESGILTVRAEEKLRNNVKELTIVYSRGHRSDNEVKNALADAEENKEEDEKFLKFAYAKEYLLEYCERAAYNLEQKKLMEKHKEVYDMCKKTKISSDLLDVHHKAKIDKLIEDVKEQCQPLVEQFKFDRMPIHRK